MDELVEMRKKIDKIDEKLMDLLQKRKNITKEVGTYKRMHKIPVEDKEREKMIFEELKKKAKDKNLDSEMIRRIYREIIKDSKEGQK